MERGEDPIGPSTDRLVRLLIAALDTDLRRSVTSIAAHLPEISDESGKSRELHIDVEYLTGSFVSVLTMA